MTARQKYLFAASTGGHLAELVRIAPRFDPHPDSLWVTFRTPQSESLLKGKRVLHVPYIRPRDVKGALRAAVTMRKLLRTETFDRAVSTGSAIAVSVLPVAKSSGIPTTYIESVSRVNGPSLTGRMLGALRAADLYTQHRHWAGGRWAFYDGLLTSFTAVHRPVRERPRIFVTLGTIEGYRFDSLIDSLLRTGLVDDRTYWQLGYTDRSDLPGTVHRQVSSERFASAAREADVVVTHGGVGTIFQLLEMGVYPIVVPRDKVRNEHVDNHQYQIAKLVDELGIGMMREPSTLTAESVLAASGMAVAAASHDESRSR